MIINGLIVMFTGWIIYKSFQQVGRARAHRVAAVAPGHGWEGPTYCIDWGMNPSAVLARARADDVTDKLGLRRRDAEFLVGEAEFTREELERAELELLWKDEDGRVEKMAATMAQAQAPAMTVNGQPPINITINNGPQGTTTAMPAGDVPVYFEDDEPKTFTDFAGQPHIITSFEKAIQALPMDKCALDPQLLLGPPGMGKTLLAKIITNTLKDRNTMLGLPAPDFIEVFPADIADVSELDAIVRRAAARTGSVIFIDEIHEFSDKHATKMYMLLNEKRYKFHDEATPRLLPDITVLGATTDAGLMKPAMLRRFQHWNFMPASKEELRGYIRRRKFPAAESSVELIVDRTYHSGAPWEGLQLRKQAEIFARARRAEEIAAADVEEVFYVQGIDQLGLRTIDRRVLHAMIRCPRFRNRPRGGGTEFVAYGQSEQVICQMAGIDRAQYRESIKPRLMARGLVDVRFGYGQCLTQRGIEHQQRHAEEQPSTP